MQTAQDCKFVSVTPPAAIINNASATTVEIDTLGYGYCVVMCYVGATDIAMTVLKIQESDTSGSGFADVTGLVYGAATTLDIAGTASALPTATDDNKCFSFEIDMKGRKRYLDLVATIGAGTTGAFFAAWAMLFDPSSGSTSISSRGFGSIVRV